MRALQKAQCRLYKYSHCQTYEVAVCQAQAKLLAVSNMVVLVYWF